jgi:hypothetical protein
MAQRRFEESARLQQHERQYGVVSHASSFVLLPPTCLFYRHSVLLLELDKNRSQPHRRLPLPLTCFCRLLIDRLVSDNSKLIAAVDAAHECVRCSRSRACN